MAAQYKMLILKWIEHEVVGADNADTTTSDNAICQHFAFVHDMALV